MRIRAIELILTTLVVSISMPHAIAQDAQLDRARSFLSIRSHAWMTRDNHRRAGECVSCHTTFPFMLTSIVGGVSDPKTTQVRAGIRAHIEKRVSAWGAPKEGTRPWYGGDRAEGSSDTESVLNAVALAYSDLAAGGPPSAASRRALEIMFKRQNPDGTWSPLNYGMQPWESAESRYWITAMAAVGMASVPGGLDEFPARHGRDQVRKALKRDLTPASNLHDRMMAIWADAKIGDVLSPAERVRSIEAIFAVQDSDGGFSLDRLTSWKKAPDLDQKKTSREGKSDAYSTGLVVYAMLEAGVSKKDARLQKAIAWLRSQQRADGSWPSDPMGSRQPFNLNIVRDAGSAYAMLALNAAGEWTQRPADRAINSRQEKSAVENVQPPKVTNPKADSGD